MTLREEIWMPKSWNFFFGLLDSGIRENFACGSGILGIGIQNTAQGIWNPTRRNQLPVPYCKKEREMSNLEFSFHY